MREHWSLRVEGGGSLTIARSPARASRWDSPAFGVSIEQDPALDQQNWGFEVNAVQAYGLRCADRKCICEAPSADRAGRAGSSSQAGEAKVLARRRGRAVSAGPDWAQRGEEMVRVDTADCGGKGSS
ncbi:unnamed protein product [Rangifer tarandus platyrhynchus]|uniref:Uncharacterized protein n=1 Tax=Rangifer tarandus platyrhynchus TaxID=3082113 RepID=A0AC59YDP3_RANTA